MNASRQPPFHNPALRYKLLPQFIHPSIHPSIHLTTIPPLHHPHQPTPKENPIHTGRSDPLPPSTNTTNSPLRVIDFSPSPLYAVTSTEPKPPKQRQSPLHQSSISPSTAPNPYLTPSKHSTRTPPPPHNALHTTTISQTAPNPSPILALAPPPPSIPIPLVLRERDGNGIRIQCRDRFFCENRTRQLKLHRGFFRSQTRESPRAAATKQPYGRSDESGRWAYSLGGCVQGFALLRVRPYLSDGDA